MFETGEMLNMLNVLNVLGEIGLKHPNINIFNISLVSADFEKNI